jgi:hypothetical protein
MSRDIGRDIVLYFMVGAFLPQFHADFFYVL